MTRKIVRRASFKALTVLSLIAIIITTLTSTGLFLSASFAEDVQVLTANPGSGLTYNGQTSPNTDVQLSSTGSISIPVSNGEYRKTLNGVHIPGGSQFSLRVQPVSTLQVSAPVFGMAITRNGSVSGNVGTLSMSGIPSGTYDITVSGRSPGSPVTAELTANQNTRSDSNGDYSMTVNTGGLPSGVYAVNANGVHVADAYVGVTPPATPTPAPAPAPTANTTPTATSTPGSSSTSGQLSGSTASPATTASAGPTSPVETSPTTVANGSAPLQESIMSESNILYLAIILLVLVVTAGTAYFLSRK